MSNNDSNSPMNVVEVNLNNKGNNIQTINTNINYHEINAYNYNSNKDTDNSGDGLSNNQEDVEEEKEQEQEEEELSMAEIAHLKKIHEQTMLRSEKYANIYSPQNSAKKQSSSSENDSKEEINTTTTEENINTTTHNILEIYSENDNGHINEQKINPNKERIFSIVHCFFYLDNEPLIIIGPDLSYFILVFTMTSFFSVVVYSLKTSSFFTTFLFVIGYIFFAVCYILLMVVNPGIPSEKKHYDINDLNFNYIQCKKCNCIYHKDDYKNVNHCNECGICVEGCEQHCNFATKCIGRKNKKIFKAWIISTISLVFIMFLYLIF